MTKKIIFSFALIFCMSLVFIFSGSSVVSASTKERNADGFTAKALYLMDYNTGEVLFENNSEAKLPVASIVKLMTINLTCKEIENGNLSLDDVVVASEKAASMGGSQVFIEEGGEYTIGDLLKSSIVSSANDASVLLSETIAGSEENFVSLMNKEAKRLGLSNTNYVNCTGLPASNQFSCARDVAVLLKEVSKSDIYHKYSTIWMDTLSHPKGRESELVNTNKLIRYYDGCDGGKTGSTSEAGYCLVATAKRGNMRLIGAVLGAETGKARFAETSKLLNFGFSNFENRLVVSNSFLKENLVQVKNGKSSQIKVGLSKEVYVLSKKRGEEAEILTQVNLIDNVVAPVKKGDKIGEILVIKNGQVIDKVDILSLNTIEKAGYFDSIQNLMQNWKIVSAKN